MRFIGKTTLLVMLVCSLLTSSLCFAQQQPALELTAPGAVLMEMSTGKVLYEKDSHVERPIASVTKIMTTLLIMEAIDSGSLKYSDMVTVGEYAAKMGGSQIYLEVGEQMSVDDMLKAILVSSANDACAAMAEHLAGSVETFVANMNQRAQELGMNNTHFVNTNGLDVDHHYSSAYDVALMSRELLKHQDVKKYTTIWQDTLRNGAFGLSNTNKLIRFYEGATGLKTGYTTNAKHCLSASALKNGMELIAVVLAAPSSNDRFNDAKKMLDFGFANYEIQQVLSNDEVIGTVPIEKGKTDVLQLVGSNHFSVLNQKSGKKEIERKIEIPPSVQAPVEKGQMVGHVKFFCDGEELGQIDLIALEAVEKKSYFDIFSSILNAWFCE